MGVLAFPRSLAGVFRVGCRRSSPWSPAVRVPSLETVFGVSAIALPVVPVVAGGGGLLGRVWEGATAPLPIERVVSAANSFVASQQSYPQALRAPAHIVVSICNSYLQGYKDLGGVRCGRFLLKRGSDVEDKRGSDVEWIT